MPDDEAPDAQIDIYVTSGTPPAAEQPLVDAFTAPGVHVRVRAWPARRGTDALDWLFLVALPLHAFLGGFGGRLADDTYRRLRELTRRTPQAPSAPPFVLQDTATGIRVVLGPEADEEAYRKLRSLDLSQFRYDTLRYDAAEARWVSVPSGDDSGA
ncbi:hypothetical protein DI272_15230 [Streptomyces sp. Act143]|uniref:hypothetical protein n=1 Tax=Streptomyces sp. Act143 TaxID=2200760 RepID=UPI000D679BF2|nr:hypothetical protein [Streptomyces sp. Act143]PWI15367.1 hypothetical protein DI272_15230 [Streptomyces sp. Act143]